MESTLDQIDRVSYATPGISKQATSKPVDNPVRANTMNISEDDHIHSPCRENRLPILKRKRSSRSRSYSRSRSASRSRSYSKNSRKPKKSSRFSSSSSESSRDSSDSKEDGQFSEDSVEPDGSVIKDGENCFYERELEATDFQDPTEMLEQSLEEDAENNLHSDVDRDGYIPQTMNVDLNLSRESANQNYLSETETSLEEGIFKSKLGLYTPHEGPWFRLNEAVAKLISDPELGEVIHFRDKLITDKLFHKATGYPGWLISPKGQLGENSPLLKALLANCIPYEPADKAKEVKRRNSIAADLFAFLHDSDFYANQLGWSKVENKEEIRVRDTPSWLEEFTKEKFKAKNLEPAPAWKFVGTNESAHIFETLSSRMEEEFKKEGSKIAGSWGEVSQRTLESLEFKRKDAFSSSRTMMILDALRKILQMASMPDPAITPTTYRALFQRALAMTDEITRFVEPNVKSSLASFAKARREVRDQYIGNMKPSSFR